MTFLREFLNRYEKITKTSFLRHYLSHRHLHPVFWFMHQCTETFLKKLFINYESFISLSNFNDSYRKVASSSLSWLVAHFQIFSWLMKEKFHAYVLWPLAKKFQNWIVDRSTPSNFNPVKHGTGHFPPWVFVKSHFVSWFFFKTFQTLLEVKIEINRVILTPCPTH